MHHGPGCRSRLSGMPEYRGTVPLDVMACSGIPECHFAQVDLPQVRYSCRPWRERTMAQTGSERSEAGRFERGPGPSGDPRREAVHLAFSVCPKSRYWPAAFACEAGEVRTSGIPVGWIPASIPEVRNTGGRGSVHTGGPPAISPGIPEDETLRVVGNFPACPVRRSSGILAGCG